METSEFFSFTSPTLLLLVSLLSGLEDPNTRTAWKRL
uniref:Uncharacterized protein n=1 Tax=Polynucleobacter necessarius subsp. necessarius (strain STIR1) TaxID=452638 RepID=B1XVD8_POLNS